MALIGGMGDILFRLAGTGPDGFSLKWFLLASLLYSTTIFGWFFVMKHLKFATVGVYYGISSLLFLVIVGVVVFEESLKFHEIVGVCFALASMVLLGRYA